MSRYLFQTDGPPGLLHLFGMAVFVVGVGVLITWMAVVPVQRDAASPSWPTAPAVVAWSSTLPCTDQRGTQFFLSYDYVVQGKPYTGHGENFFSRPCLPEEDARALVARYPVGQAIEIRFDPEKPSVSTIRAGTLSKGRRLFQYAYWLLGVGYLVRAWFRYRAGKA